MGSTSLRQRAQYISMRVLIFGTIWASKTFTTLSQTNRQMTVELVLASCIFHWACRGTVHCGPKSKQRSGLCSRNKEGVWFLTQPNRGGREEEREGGGRDFTARAEQSGAPAWRACMLTVRQKHLEKKNRAKRQNVQCLKHS